jgi:hypothetical protein
VDWKGSGIGGLGGSRIRRLDAEFFVPGHVWVFVGCEQ